ncbi:hypothetical protein ACM01_10035 [Streptomyces viridochromogenes]|uniref:HEAT repeat domain-containing protein n=1 Tax=Streptomyces viridochromogenes TaxID=1938 RepID=A0A0J7ZGZ1_STRVR|nr:HEAT repeat domain-containing protein [Streptomyces viridochromogenes]KMS75321.1 hypothetical protein ACM01_10035 [Streptomyces viridochromogenes]KOG19496.1 hypothetical protein ADK36_19200 [Streptomyces viridochromogenes]KOG20958.1 hypothetical protein ADK35_17660 [Streptomyces viridochromogenes]
MADYDVRLALKAEKAEAGVASFAMRNRWEMRILGNRKADIFMNVWITSDRVEVHYIEDPLTGIPFVTFRGENSARTAEMLKASCNVWEFSEALEGARRAADRDARLTAVYAAAFTAPEQPVDEMIELFHSLATDPDAGVRQSIVVSTGYVPWPQLVEIVRELSRTDPVDHVRENARLLLEGLSIHGNEN